MSESEGVGKIDTTLPGRESPEPWEFSRPVGDGSVLRYSWIQHTDALRDGGRVAVHRGACGHDAAHLILWHSCSGAVDMKAYGEAETVLYYPRWIPSMDPSLRVWRTDKTLTLWAEAGDGGAMRWPKCCGLAGRVRDGVWVAA